MKTGLRFCKTIIGLMAAVWVWTSVVAEETAPSAVHMPISIDMLTLEQLINELLSKRIVTIDDPNQVCAKPVRFTTDVPYLEIINWKPKLISKRVTTNLTPAIKCDVVGYVERRGDLFIRGGEGSLMLSIPLHVSVSGKNIAGVIASETVTMDVTVSAILALDIDSNWNPVVQIEIDFKWDTVPTVVLFDIVDVPVPGLVEARLREELEKIEQKVSGASYKLGLRETVSKAWEQLQQPVVLSREPRAYGKFVPTEVGFSGLSISDDEIYLHVVARGVTEMVVGPKPDVVFVPLLSLERITFDEPFFSLKVPIIIHEQELQQAIESQVSDGVSWEVPVGEFTATDFVVSVSANHGLVLSALVGLDNQSGWWSVIDFFDWFNFSGTAKMEITLALEPEGELLKVSTLRLDSDTESELADTLIDVLDLPLIRNRLAELLAYDYSDQLEEGMQAANKALNVTLSEHLRLAGRLDAGGPAGLEIEDDMIVVEVFAKGVAMLEVGH